MYIQQNINQNNISIFSLTRAAVDPDEAAEIDRLIGEIEGKRGEELRGLPEAKITVSDGHHQRTTAQNRGFGKKPVEDRGYCF